MLFRIPFLVCFWARVGHKKICTRFGGQKQNIHVYAQTVSTESGAVTAHTRRLRSTGSHCFHGTAIGPTVPSAPTFKTHPIAFNSWAKYVFSYMTKDSAPFAVTHITEVGGNKRLIQASIHPHGHHINLAGSSLSLLFHTSCLFLLPDYLPSRLQVRSISTRSISNSHIQAV